MGALGHAFGLLRLPGMSETKKGRGVAAFVPSPVDPESGALPPPPACLGRGASTPRPRSSRLVSSCAK